MVREEWMDDVGDGVDREVGWGAVRSGWMVMKEGRAWVVREEWVDDMGDGVDREAGWVVVRNGWMVMEVDSERGVDG